MCAPSLSQASQPFPEMLRSSPCPLSHCRVDICSHSSRMGNLIILSQSLPLELISEGRVRQGSGRASSIPGLPGREPVGACEFPSASLFSSQRQPLMQHQFLCRRALGGLRAQMPPQIKLKPSSSFSKIQIWSSLASKRPGVGDILGG